MAQSDPLYCVARIGPDGVGIVRNADDAYLITDDRDAVISCALWMREHHPEILYKAMELVPLNDQPRTRQ